MKMSNLIVPSAICFFMMAGCVSTTTGSITEPVRDDRHAADLNYELGARYYQQGSYDLARERLLKAIEVDPKMAVAYSALAMTYEALGNVRLATEAYESAVKVGPRDFDVQNKYAVFLCKRGDFDQARKHFDKAIKHPENDNSEVTATNAGICMLQEPNAEQAEKYFRVALESKPTFGEPLIQLCLLKYREKDYLSARAFLQRFMSSNKTTSEVLFLAGKIEDMLGNDRGRTDYEDRLLREFPTSPEAKKVLGSG